MKRDKDSLGNYIKGTILILSFITFFACSFLQDKVSMLNRYQLNSKNIKSVELSDDLREISGIVISDGKLFAHNDEQGIIYQVDYNTGNILKKFSLGEKTLKADIEDIAIVDNRFYVIVSNGEILEFKEAENNSYTSYKIYKTGLTSDNNVEGICYDDETNSLLLACKGSPGKGLDGFRAVYSFSLKDNKLNSKPRFTIPIKEITTKLGAEDFSPSSIRKHPVSKTFFILSAKDRALIEISPQGKILNSIKLNKKIHKKPEGIAFTQDLTLLISDEGKKHNGEISIYPYIK